MPQLQGRVSWFPFLPAIPRNANEVILFYKRADNKYTGWGLHLFPVSPATPAWTIWTGAYGYEGVDPNYGAYFRITLPPNPGYSATPAALTQFPDDLGFIIHSGETKDPGPDQHLKIAQTGNISSAAPASTGRFTPMTPPNADTGSHSSARL